MSVCWLIGWQVCHNFLQITIPSLLSEHFFIFVSKLKNEFNSSFKIWAIYLIFLEKSWDTKLINSNPASSKSFLIYNTHFNGVIIDGGGEIFNQSRDYK